jgi:hypothetical protein
MVVVPHTKESKSQKVASSMVKEGVILSEERASSEHSDSTHLFILNIELRNPSSTKATSKIHQRKSSKDEAVTMADINLS